MIVPPHGGEGRPESASATRATFLLLGQGTVTILRDRTLKKRDPPTPKVKLTILFGERKLCVLIWETNLALLIPSQSTALVFNNLDMIILVPMV